MGGSKRKRILQYRRLLYCFVFPLLFSLLLLWYVKNAAAEVVYSDYIRLVNSYLPDPLSPEKLLVPDVLTRIPITYLARFLNVRLFGYSVTFDRLLGILGLLLSASVLGLYAERQNLSVLSLLALFFVLFSLNKWEMLLNGSGYPHFLAFAFFYRHALILDKACTGSAGCRERRELLLLPWITLLFAGPYLLAYAATMLFCYAFLLLSGNRNIEKRELWLCMLSVMLPLLLYFLSNHYAVYEYAGADGRKLGSLLLEDPLFVLRFLLNGFASMLLSGVLLEELLSRGVLSSSTVYLLGAFVLLLYLFSAGLYFRKKLWKTTVFPAILLLYGLGSHGIVFLSRYIFLRESYAWQSRYALQYQSGILGILLILALWRKEAEKERAVRGRGHFFPVLFSSLLSLTFVTGNCYTTSRELEIMPWRELRYEEMREAAQAPENYSDEELERIFEYYHGGDRIRQALSILKEQRLNVYRERG